MSMGISMGKDKRMGEGVGRSKDVQAGSRRAAARSTDPTQHPAHKGQPGQCKGNGHKAKKANKVGISERDNSRMGNIAGLRIAKSRVRIPARAASPEPELGPRSSVLGYLVQLERHFFLVAVDVLSCPALLT